MVREMCSVVKRYFSLNRILLLIIGLWPYEKSKLARFHLICFFSILITSIIFQLTTFVTSKITTDLVIRVLSFACFIINLTIIYNSFRVNGKTVICLMEQLQHIYDDLKDNSEIAIVEKYGNNSKRYTGACTITLVIGICAHISIQLWPNVRGIILPVNASRSLYLQALTEYFIDQERYFYLIRLHLDVSLYIGFSAGVATGMMLFACLQHACGMFKIASYRIENAMKIYIYQGTILQNKDLIYGRIICAVDIHRKAMMFSEYLASNFQTSFMFLILFGVITISLNIFRIISSSCNIEELLIHFVITCGSLLYMFLSNLIGQEITDHYNYIFLTAYKTRWYVAPLHVQWLLLFLLQRGNKTFRLNVGGLFVSSLECFATLVNASVSYFVVIYSMQ